MVIIEGWDRPRSIMLDLRTAREAFFPPWIKRASSSPTEDAIAHAAICGVSTPEGWEAHWK